MAMTMDEQITWLRELIKWDLARWRGKAELLRPQAREGCIFVPLQEAESQVAECEAKLAIVDLCAKVIIDDEGHEYWSDGWAGLGVAKFVIGSLSAGYRHRPGYQEEWAATPWR